MLAPLEKNKRLDKFKNLVSLLVKLFPNVTKEIKLPFLVFLLFSSVLICLLKSSIFLIAKNVLSFLGL